MQNSRSFAALTQAFAMAVLLAMTATTIVGQADLHNSGGHDLQISGFHSKYVNFAEGFAFPFGGVAHAGAWVHGNGYVSFGGSGFPDTSPTVSEFLERKGQFSVATGMMRIAPLWTDLNPNPAGRGRVLAGPVGSSTYRITWLDVPFGMVSNQSATVSLVLRANGSFQFVYENVLTVFGPTIVGYTAGHEQTSIAARSTDLSRQSGTIGNGTEPCVYEYFFTELDLHGRTLEFAPVLPTSGVISLADNDAIEIDLGFAFPFYGNRYQSVWVGSDGELNFTRWAPFFHGHTEQALLDDTARIIPFGADLDPTGNGNLRVTRGSGNAVIHWTGVSESGQSNSNSFSVTLRKDGSFSFSYGRVDSPSQNSTLAIGVTGGYPVTTGTEGQTIFVGGNTYGSGTEAAIYQIVEGKNTGLSYKELHFRPFTGKSSLPLMTANDRGSTHRFDFQNGFTFPFAGTDYESMFVNSNGTITFGSGDTELVATQGAMLEGFPRLAPFWAKHNPKSCVAIPGVEGSIDVVSLIDRVEVRYNTPLWGLYGSAPSWSTFTVVLKKDGDFSYRYGRMATAAGLAGYSTGAVNACSCESKQDLSISNPPNHGTEAAVWEQFYGSVPLDLANRTLAFKGVSGIALRTVAAVGGTADMTLSAGAAYAGLEYMQVLSLSATTGFRLPDSRRFPLDPDPIFVMSLAGLSITTGFTGRLDANGRSVHSQLAIPDMAELTGLDVHSAFVAFSPEASMGIAYISDSGVVGIAPGAKKKPKCRIAVQTLAMAVGWSVTVTAWDAAGLPRAGAMVSCRIYNGNQGQPLAPMQFKATNGAGVAVFNINAGVGVPRTFVKGMVAPSHNCPLIRYLK